MLKVIFHVHQNIQQQGDKSLFLTSLLDIDPLEIKNPSFNQFLLAYTQIYRQIKDKISYNELLAYNQFQPVFRINAEFEKHGKNDFINHEYNTPLLSFYLFSEAEVRASAERMFVLISTNYLKHISRSTTSEEKQNA